MSISDYNAKLADVFGGLFTLSDTGYPVILARAFYSHGEIYCRGNPGDSLFWHEVGHAVGKKHVFDRKNVMFPWFFRGREGIDEIKKLMVEKYGELEYDNQ